MKRINILGWYSKIPTKLWIDIWCFVALIRFALGKPVDSTTLLGVLGIYTTHKIGTRMVIRGNPDVN